MIQSVVVLSLLASVSVSGFKTICDKYTNAFTGADTSDIPAFKTAQETVITLLVSIHIYDYFAIGLSNV